MSDEQDPMAAAAQPVVAEAAAVEQPAAENKSPDELAAESELREALRMVVDPEINIDIVTLGLIREIEFRPNEGQVEVRMILTTPFCPYAGTLIQQVKDVTRQLSPLDPIVTLMEEPQWSPELMEGGDWSDWGLI
jgi:metal-sulfur cluster biosynthetic enzyme